MKKKEKKLEIYKGAKQYEERELTKRPSVMLTEKDKYKSRSSKKRELKKMVEEYQ